MGYVPARRWRCALSGQIVGHLANLNLSLVRAGQGRSESRSRQRFRKSYIESSACAGSE